MRTSFHHQPEAQHPNFQLATSWHADYSIFCAALGEAIKPIYDWWFPFTGLNSISSQNPTYPVSHKTRSTAARCHPNRKPRISTSRKNQSI